MKLPRMRYNVYKNKKYTVAFGGINKTGNAREGEMTDSKNLTTDFLPYISPSGVKHLHSATADKDISTVFSHNELMFVGAEGKLYYESGEKTEDGGIVGIIKETDAVLSGDKKQIARIGNEICIFPDMVKLNATDYTLSEMAFALSVPGEESHNGSYWQYYEVRKDRIVIYDRMGVCSRKETTHNIFKYYWNSPGTYGASASRLKAGDNIKISSFKCVGDSNGLVNVKGVESAKIASVTYSDGKATITFEAEVFTALSGFTADCEGHSEITMTKEFPMLNHVCSHGGRLWGTDNDNNEIHASKYNDPGNFNAFDQTAADSYSMSVHTPGEFTGCIGFINCVCFFKENSIMRIYGNRPAAFSMSEQTAPGVEKGSDGSLALIGDVLYYKGKNGVYAYSGGTPYLISGALGNERYTDAVGCAYDNKYYISMKNTDGKRILFVYDTLNRIWLKEGETGFVSATVYENKLYYVDETERKIRVIDKDESSDGVEWMAELCEFNETVNEKKGYSRITLRYDMKKGAYFSIELLLDRGIYKKIKTINKEGCGSVMIPIPPNRCDSFKIRLSGKGECKIMNLVREFKTKREV